MATKSSQPSKDLIRIVRAYQGVSADMRNRIEQFVTRKWQSLPNYRDDDIKQLMKAVVPMVEGGQKRMSSMTDAYLLAVARANGVKKSKSGKLVTSVKDVRGVPADEVYIRPGKAVYVSLSKGNNFEDAKHAGLNRLISLAMTDLQLAKTHTVRNFGMSNGGVVGYERVIDGHRDCALCIVASTQRYHKEDLMPIHPGCGCDVQPLYGEFDPGQVIHEDRLSDIHDKVQEELGVSDASAHSPEYSKLLVVREHGELGPLLTIKGQNFTGPSDI